MILIRKEIILFFKRRNKPKTTPIENVKPKIINLSSTKLSQDQINILKLGLKFCPTPKYFRNKERPKGI